MNRHGTAEVTLPSDTTIQVIRRFDAPATLVWEAWTTPEHIRNWWGWESMPMEVCDFDLSVGGTYRFTTRLPDGSEMGFNGTNLEIDAPHRLVSTEVFEAMPDEMATNTLILEEEDGVTTATLLMQYPSQATRDAVIESGMESGLSHSLDRLENIVAPATAQPVGARA